LFFNTNCFVFSDNRFSSEVPKEEEEEKERKKKRKERVYLQSGTLQEWASNQLHGSRQDVLADDGGLVSLEDGSGEVECQMSEVEVRIANQRSELSEDGIEEILSALLLSIVLDDDRKSKQRVLLQLSIGFSQERSEFFDGIAEDWSEIEMKTRRSNVLEGLHSSQASNFVAEAVLEDLENGGKFSLQFITQVGQNESSAADGAFFHFLVDVLSLQLFKSRFEQIGNEGLVVESGVLQKKKTKSFFF
jgi:hypothetical protein